MSYQGQSPKVKRTRFTPQSSDPANPLQGDLFCSDGTSRAAGLWQYLGGAWQQLASGDSSPTATVVAYAGPTAPGGWLLCDGSAVSRTTYATLFAVIGTTHGIGNGTTTFNLPDYRGRFLRGVDGLANQDPDSASRTAMNPGGNTGNNVGSMQSDAFQGHWHYPVQTNDGTFRTAKAQTGVAGSSIPGVRTDAGTDMYAKEPVTGSHGFPKVSTETRPINAYVNFIIKA